MSPDEIDISGFEDENRSAVLELMGAAPFKNVIWEWQFSQVPGAGRVSPLVVKDKSARVVGFNGVMPIRVKYGEREIDAAWSCDFYMHSTCRGKGYGKEVKRVQREMSNLIMAFGISSMASPVLLKMGWRENGEVLSFKRLRKATSLKGGVIKTLQWAGWLKNIGRSRARGNLQVKIENSLPEADVLERLWHKVAPGYRKIVVRDARYMQWKYRDHPLCDYQYICIYDNSELVALAVIRAGHLYGQLVDYLGPADNQNIKLLIVSEFCRYYQHKPQLRCLTSDAGFFKALEANFFYREKNRPRFYVYSNLEADDGLGDWFIMGGDSDADLLQASRESSLEALPDGISVRKLGVEQFMSMESEWQSLLSRSSMNELFLSWLWQSTWWRVWGEEGGFELNLLAAYAEDGGLLGLAPMYKSKTGRGQVRLQFIGQHWHDLNNIRSEYLDFIADDRRAAGVIRAFSDHIKADGTWDELVLCDISSDSLIHELIDRANFSNCYFRRTSDDCGVEVGCEGEYEAYVDGLGKNTRYKMRNRRAFLEKHHQVQYESASQETLEADFSSLNELHHIRWGEPCFREAATDFHKRVSAQMMTDGGVKLTKLVVNGKTESVLYNLCVEGHEYNIQSSFNQEFDKRISLGTLHFAYSMEDAFGDSDVRYYDFLAGEGKETFYKNRFKGTVTHFSTIQMVRSPSMKLLYRLYDYSPRNFKSFARGLLRRRVGVGV